MPAPAASRFARAPFSRAACCLSRKYAIAFSLIQSAAFPIPGIGIALIAASAARLIKLRGFFHLSILPFIMLPNLCTLVRRRALSLATAAMASVVSLTWFSPPRECFVLVFQKLREEYTAPTGVSL